MSDYVYLVEYALGIGILLSIILIGRDLLKSLGTRWDANRPSDEKVKKFNEDQTEFKFECPKCLGTDVYFADQQIITGLGGIYGSRAKQIKKPFCRNCDVVANTILIDSNGEPKKMQLRDLDALSSALLWMLGAAIITYLIFNQF